MTVPSARLVAQPTGGRDPPVAQSTAGRDPSVAQATARRDLFVAQPTAGRAAPLAQATAERAQPSLAWPGAKHLRYALALALANGLWFELVFAGCDFLTSQRTLRLRVDLPGELAIPFVASATALYMSMYFLFIAGPFILRRRREFRAAILMLATIIGIAGVCFLLFPVELAYPPVQESELGVWAGLFHVADALNLTYDLVPSLHVALTVGCVLAFNTRFEGAGRALLWIWASAVALSTLLTHQHHVLDVITGWLLAVLCFKYVYKPRAGQ